jgi:hypothetical protein
LATELLAALQDIKKEQLTITKNAPLIYSFRRDEDAERLGLSKNPDEQQKILKKLEELGAFGIVELPISKDWSMFTKDNAPLLVREYELQINQEKFDQLYSELEDKTTNSSPKDLVNEDDTQSTFEVRLVKDGADLLLVTPTEKVHLTRLKTGLIPERLFGALINNKSGRLVKASELKGEVDGLSGLKDISEVIRLAGFNRDSKRIFFKHCGENEVELRNPAQVTKSELNRLITTFRAKP